MTDEERLPSPTIFEVAQAAGVSITTVSHVFSGKRPVNEETRQRVIVAADQLGYRASRNARGLATGRTMTIAVQLPMTAPDLVFNPYFSLLMPALSEVCVALGYAFALVPPYPSRAAFIEPLVARRAIDAAILIDPRPGDPFPLALADAGLPFVSLGRVPDIPATPRVDQDFDAAMVGIVEHLRQNGYSTPALLTIPDELSALEDIRQAFLRRAPRRLVAVAEDYSDGAAITAAAELLKAGSPPDAIICLTERQAIGAYRAAADLDLEIPGDLGVVSLGESAVSRSLQPPATSLSVFPELSGEALAKLTSKLLEGGPVPLLTLIPTELVVRASTLRGR